MPSLKVQREYVWWWMCPEDERERWAAEYIDGDRPVKIPFPKEWSRAEIEAWCGRNGFVPEISEEVIRV